MATEFRVLKGKGKWTKVFLPDSTFGDPAWKTDLYMDAANVEAFKALKVKNKVYRDDDGDFVHLKRDVEKTMKGQKVTFSPPIVSNKDGTPFTGNSIGNGSDLTVTLEYYSWPGRPGVLPGYGIRLHSLQVDNLVPYQPNKVKEVDGEAAPMAT